jgi:DNA adenine methylase
MRTNMNITAKPFLKWAGGKGQMIEKFQKLYPHDLKNGKIKTYYEPFTGGGAVFFDICQKYSIDKAFLYDINDELILAYRVIQNDVYRLLEILGQYSNDYLCLEKKDRKKYFYRIRSEFNNQRVNINYNDYSGSWIIRAAQMIFLNKTCYNGLYRVNAGSEFNAPAGNYKNPAIIDEDNLIRVSELLRITEIKKADFRTVEINESNSFVYFDPPYRPLSATSSFTSYTNSDFREEDQIQLAEIIKALDRRKVKVMLSNSDPKNIDPADDFFDNLYSGFNILRLPARRLINSRATARGAINEIVVTNYDI